MPPNGETPKVSPNQKKIDDGKRWLEILGEDNLIGTPLILKDGRELKAEEFTLIYDDELYRERVLPMFLALENDPNDEGYKTVLRKILHSYIDTQVEES